MKQIFSSKDSAEVGLLKSFLEEAGIQSMERNEQVEIQAVSFEPELWVNDEDYPAAMELLQSWQRPPSLEKESWVCSKCGESQEPQFQSCWKCGAPREMLA